MLTVLVILALIKLSYQQWKEDHAVIEETDEHWTENWHENEPI